MSNGKSETFFSTYKVFNEPEKANALRLRFYLLIISFSNFDSTRIISIRQDSSAVYADYKMASYSEIPSIQRVTDFDSTTFFYSTIHFKLAEREIDTLKTWVTSFDLRALKDSVNDKHLDGGMREIILFDGDRIYHIYRTFGSDKELEPNLKLFLDRVRSKYMADLAKPNP